jgi:hypothetical protein
MGMLLVRHRVARAQAEEAARALAQATKDSWHVEAERARAEQADAPAPVEAPVATAAPEPSKEAPRGEYRRHGKRR